MEIDTVETYIDTQGNQAVQDSSSFVTFKNPFSESHECSLKSITYIKHLEIAPAIHHRKNKESWNQA